MAYQSLLQLPLARYRFDFADPSQRPAPRFAGSAWRGALGHELRRIACLTGARECEGCTLLHQCAYSYLFATPVPPEATKLTRYSEAPNPYVLGEEHMEPGKIRLHLTLFGKSNRHLPLMYQALLRGASGEKGIAGRRMAFVEMRQWRDAGEEWASILTSHGAPQGNAPTTPKAPPCPFGTIEIELMTPLRIRRNGRHVTPEQFAFSDLFGNLLRRISLLTSFHTDTPLDVDFSGLNQNARTVPLLAAQLQWVDLRRHSQRQHTDMEIGGLVGSVWVDGALLESFWPFLWLGQYTHVGRSTTMGLGAYRLHAESLPGPMPNP
ncbi:MAG: CRISPR system precrRNA processing endoribonuclease RAMP protein Cas6 [Thiomonas sp.]|uniref:CRISPR system precrRNA processing endoribonuclease RAMP protein Cas6 n=1 Tax=Thiomonas sp. TaxID=2047785 RepID=UPI002A36CD33|nr:CRISPR system precrRNA processing endoribonuclease RAMP protein Cas6 [Thiomonas sp.]MDY0331669.1 CRISPR system precrRNA processing endoribonuclease RAMP protein Cas6 [Thiomonas sp.]